MHLKNQFKQEKLAKACEDLIVLNLPKITKSEQGLDFIKDLPVEYFKNICAADNLYIEDEKIVVNLIEEYLNHRKDLPLLPEELP